jgi:hypothetical protein
MAKTVSSQAKDTPNEADVLRSCDENDTDEVDDRDHAAGNELAP